MENKTWVERFLEWYLIYAISLVIMFLAAFAVWFGIFFLYSHEAAANNQWIVGIPPYILAIPGTLFTRKTVRKILNT